MANNAKDARSSVEKSLDVLAAFAGSDTTGLGVSEIARRTGLSKSTVHRILALMLPAGAVVKSSGMYRLGPLVFNLTSVATSERTKVIGDVLTPFLTALFEQTRTTVNLAYVHGTEVIMVNKLFSVSKRGTPGRIGERAPVHCTAIGKAIVAFDPPVLEQVLSARELVPWTAHSITEPDVLRAQLAEVKETGIAYNRDELLEGTSSIAAPIFGVGEAPVAAMSVTSFSDSFEPERSIPILRRVVANASRAFRDFEHGLTFSRTPGPLVE